MHEMNPMLGLRGCRLGIMFPEIYGMQVRAIALASCKLKKAGKDPRPEIMIPLVSVVTELETLRAESQKIVDEVQTAEGCVITIPIGTMIELPRAVITADEIGKVADFFSYGTNDLTQTTFGFSRDDIESTFLPRALQRKILTRNPSGAVAAGGAEPVRIRPGRGRRAHPGTQPGGRGWWLRGRAGGR